MEMEIEIEKIDVIMDCCITKPKPFMLRVTNAPINMYGLKMQPTNAYQQHQNTSPVRRS